MYKAVHVIYDCVIEERVMQLLKDLNIERYIKASKLECEWKKDLRHLNTHIWPGTDSMIMLVLETAAARELLSAIRDLKADLSQNVPVLALVMPIEEIA